MEELDRKELPLVVLAEEDNKTVPMSRKLEEGRKRLEEMMANGGRKFVLPCRTRRKKHPQVGKQGTLTSYLSKPIVGGMTMSNGGLKRKMVEPDENDGVVLMDLDMVSKRLRTSACMTAPFEGPQSHSKTDPVCSKMIAKKVSDDSIPMGFKEKINFTKSS